MGAGVNHRRLYLGLILGVPTAIFTLIMQAALDGLCPSRTPTKTITIVLQQPTPAAVESVSGPAPTADHSVQVAAISHPRITGPTPPQPPARPVARPEQVTVVGKVDQIDAVLGAVLLDTQPPSFVRLALADQPMLQSLKKGDLVSATGRVQFVEGTDLLGIADAVLVH